MYSIFDTDGWVDDFATLTTMYDVQEIARLNNLTQLRDFFELGYSVDLIKLAEEVEKFDWPVIDFIKETMDAFAKTVRLSDEIVIIHDGQE